MLIPNNLFKICSLLVVLTIGVSPVLAKNKTTKKGAKKQSVTAATAVKIVESPQNKVEVVSNNGDLFVLPKYDQIHITEPIGQTKLAIASDSYASADITMGSALLKEKLIEKKEMRELSERLGIEINDAEYLDFYREVADWLGTRYRRGGMSRAFVDCSGFTNIIYKTVFGIQLDRVSTSIAKNVAESVAKEDLLPGDMVFFSTFGKKYINHVGVYLGEGRFIHASIKHGVIVSSLAEGYYSKAWRKGGRMN